MQSTKYLFSCSIAVTSVASMEQRTAWSRDSQHCTNRYGLIYLPSAPPHISGSRMGLFWCWLWGRKEKGLLRETRPEMQGSERMAVSWTGQEQAHRNGWLGPQEIGREVGWVTVGWRCAACASHCSPVPAAQDIHPFELLVSLFWGLLLW